MFDALIALCAVVATFTFCRYFAAKTRRVENDIKAVVERKLATSDYRIQLSQLKEENAVMRNILLDLVENETCSPVVRSGSQADLARFKRTKIQRYREILAESVHVLQQRAYERTLDPGAKALSVKSDKL
jgi:hypothetical protein